jgi:4-aminobutyrate aminotransferase/(S)-3-amino-2-methylpropionate transaminase
LVNICHKHGVLFIADEIQSGFGRTGALFASERYGIEPDILVTAKSIGGGLPLAAITGRAEIMDAPGPGGLGGTFAGNPVACEAALAVLDMFEQQDLNARAQSLGDHFQKRAREWQKRWPLIGEVRGLGAMQAVELVQSQDKREPASEETKQVTQYCYEHGVITISAGSYGNVIRLLMPLVITDAQMDEALDVLEGAFKAVYERKQEAAAQPV